ncbi:MAG TPA: hypothetical protein VFZ61_08150 [Polyangiales bacterium]
MRVLGIVGLVTLGFGLVSMAGCEDAKSPSVQAEIGWKVGCAAGNSGCNPFKYHSQEQNKMPPSKFERDFKVSCSVSGDAVSFTITDVGLDATEAPPVGWPPSSISVTNGNGATNACNLTVRDQVEAADSPITMRGMCKGTSPTGGCTLTRTPPSAETKGWDWVGTLVCETILRDSVPTPAYKLTGLDSTGPITIALANCD